MQKQYKHQNSVKPVNYILLQHHFCDYNQKAKNFMQMSTEISMVFLKSEIK